MKRLFRTFVRACAFALVGGAAACSSAPSDATNTTNEALVPLRCGLPLQPQCADDLPAGHPPYCWCEPPTYSEANCQSAFGGVKTPSTLDPRCIHGTMVRNATAFMCPADVIVPSKIYGDFPEYNLVEQVQEWAPTTDKTLLPHCPIDGGRWGNSSVCYYPVSDVDPCVGAPPAGYVFILQTWIPSTTGKSHIGSSCTGLCGCPPEGSTGT
jgi:hypothetical protein